MSLRLDTILRLISLSGHSIFSLIDDILARGEWEDERFKLLREGITRDAVDICALLLSHKPASASISARALTVVPTMLSEAENLSRRDMIHRTKSPPLQACPLERPQIRHRSVIL